MSSSNGVPTPPSQTSMPQAKPAASVMRRPAASPFMQKKPRFARGRPDLARATNGTQTPTSIHSHSRSTSHPASAASPVPQPAEQPNYVEYPIVISKADLGHGARFHGIRFQSKPGSGSVGALIDPFSEEQFTRPLRLHRRYTRDKQKGSEAEQANGADDKERELYNARRAERQAEREANQALIAPSGASKKSQFRRKQNKKGVEDVYYDDKDPKQQKAAQLRYEETKPWHLEDFDGKNVWVGSYQEPLSENSVLFSVSADAFTMVPVERWYTFRQTDKITVMNSEEVEKHMSKRYLPGRWYMKTQDQNDEERKQRTVQARKHARDDDDDVKPKRAAVDAYRADLDELDFEMNEEFQDDDEGLIFGEEEDDAKEVEKRVRDEMREANLPATNMKNDEKDWDEEEDKEKEEQKAERRQQKKLRKRIVKHEKKFEYDSDSEHPYSDSDTEDSEEERLRLEEEEQKKKDEQLKPSQTNGGRSGLSTPGNNTPAGRSEKHGPARSQSGLGASLKRPGSPGLSEVSGSESRKKAKGLNGRAISSSNLGEGARSPIPRHIGNHGSGSDTDTSRAGPKKKRRVGSPDASQPGSRAVSPARAGTPPPRMPTEEEIRAAIPADGISIKDLSGRFRARVSKDKTNDFIKLVRKITTQDPTTKLLKPSVGA